MTALSVPPGDESEVDLTAGRSDSAAAALWATWTERRTRDARDRLVLHYASLVKYIAGRMGRGLPRQVERDDLTSHGIFGLIDAIERFEPERGLKFETYAMGRIRGAILDGLRGTDAAPRSVRRKAKALEDAFRSLEARLHRAPTDAELAAEMGLDDRQFRTLLRQAAMGDVQSLEQTVVADSSPTSDGLWAAPQQDPSSVVEDQAGRADLRASVAGLPDQERTVVSLYYFENLTLKQIGEVLGVTESRVSQVHAKAVVHLRARMEPAPA